MGAELPKVVHIRGLHGEGVEQNIEYEWIPTFCTVCNVFGHQENRCVKKPKVKQVWQVKEAMVEKQSVEEQMDLVEDHVVSTMEGSELISSHSTVTRVHNSF